MTTVTFSAVADPGLLGDRWRIVRELARGGCGVVYEGLDEICGDLVAIKVARGKAGGADAMTAARFEQEAEAAAMIESPHVVRILGTGLTPEQQPFLVMEYLHGEDLGAYVARVGPLPLEEVATYVMQACDALSRAHARGIIHRDIKPSNLFRHVEPDGRVVLKIVDFGISKSLERESTLTSSVEGSILGSPPYMSPEQIRDAREVDHRTDLWSLGIVCYRLLTGETPWGVTRIDEVFARILSTPGLPSLEARGLPPGIDDILARCVAPLPDDRWPDADALARMLSLYSSVTSTFVLGSSGECLPTVAIQTLRHEQSMPPENDTRRFQGWMIAAAVAIVLAGASSVVLPRSAKPPVRAPAVEAPTPIEAAIEAPIAAPAPVVVAPTSVVAVDRPAPRRVATPPARRVVTITNATATATATAPRRELQPNPYAKGDAP